MRKTYPTEDIGRRGKITQGLLSTAAIIFLLFGTTATALAQEGFEGSLNSVSIANVAGTNSPPVANFTYTQSGDTFSFDASDSSDSDGSISQYKWDFGDGSVAEGISVTHTSSENFLATLTIVDDTQNITLKQIAIMLEPINCDTQSLLFSRVEESYQTSDTYNSNHIYVSQITGNGKSLHSVKFKSSGAVQGTSVTANLYLNDSLNFSQTNISTTTIKTPGQSNALFTGTFADLPLLTDGINYYIAFDNPNSNWGSRVTMYKSQNTSGENWNTSSLSDPVTTPSDYGTWIEVFICD